MRLAYFIVWLFGFPLVVGVFSYFLLSSNYVTTEDMKFFWFIFTFTWLAGCVALIEKEEKQEDLSMLAETRVTGHTALFLISADGRSEQLRTTRYVEVLPSVDEVLSVPFDEDESADFVTGTVCEVLKTIGTLNDGEEYIITFKVSSKDYDRLKDSDIWKEFE